MCFPYCFGLGLATKETCVTFGRSLWWSSHSFYVWVGARLQGLWLLTGVPPDLIAHCWLTAPPLPTKPPPHLLFVLGQVCMQHDAKWHQLLLSLPSTVRLKEVRHRQVLVCLCGFHYPHRSSVSLRVTVCLCLSLTISALQLEDSAKYFCALRELSSKTKEVHSAWSNGKSHTKTPELSKRAPLLQDPSWNAHLQTPDKKW